MKYFDMFAGIGYFSIPIGVHSKAEKIISIAHPDFRDELAFDAKKRGIMI